MRSHIFEVMIIISIKDIPKKEQRSHARRLLRECLKPLDIAYSEDMPITKNQYGKPSLTDYPEVFYNLSHADGITACIVSDSECGIDCEPIREYRPGVMKRAFTDAEQEMIAEAPESERDTLFFQLWTLKESYIKAVGMGLSYPMRDIEFSFENGKILSNAENYRFRQYILKNKFIVSICKKATE